MRFSIAACTALFTLTFLTGCNKQASQAFIDAGFRPEREPSREQIAQKQQETAVHVQAEQKAMAESAATIAAAMYGPYKDGVIGNGQTSVLFFHAPWCGSCRDADIFLTDLYSKAETRPTLNTYIVDFDTNTALRARYGVVSQHTFVRINASGNPERVLTGPSHERLAELLR
jgi:thiol-disulfide isomerase/thioredoxin